MAIITEIYSAYTKSPVPFYFLELSNYQKTTRKDFNTTQLREEWVKRTDEPRSSRKQKREGVKESLDQWFTIVTERGVSISGN